VLLAAGLSKLSASAKSIAEASALPACLRNKRENPVEMVLKKMLK
jgi:hypothetical protein